jgi:1-acyl-sn-glycerol-3-phosphate acyltransferase
VRWLRVAYRVPAAVLVTAFFAAIPATARLVARRRPDAVLRLGTWACRGWGRALCAILRVERNVTGPIPHGGVFLVASNHLSYLDILVLGSLYPSTFLAKREIAGWPLFGWVARGAGTLFVDREQPKDVVRAGRQMTERLAMGIPMTIFPEGRSTPGREILPFQPALLEPAARAGVPCWAASISYETPGSIASPARTVCWHDQENFAKHFQRLAGLPRIAARVTFSGPPVISDDRKNLARDLWEKSTAAFAPVRQA